MEFNARMRFARIAPRKMKYVVDLVRGQNINRALETLKVVPNRGSYFLNKLLRSAIANATDRDENVDVDLLRVKTLRVDPGPAMKRIRYGPMGRVMPIKKETCHVSVVLEQVEDDGEGGKGKGRRRDAVRKAKEQVKAPAAADAKTDAKPADQK